MNVMVVGADKGLGKVLCKKLAECGHRVVAGVFERENANSSFYQELNIIAYHMDVSDERTLQNVSGELSAKELKIDAVIHVAGVLMKSDRENSLLTADIEDLMTAFRINAAGIIMNFRTMYPLMNKNGMFIAVTSEGGSFSNEGDMFPGYGITKTAANKVVQTLRCTVKDVQIIALHPGRMNTEMGRTTAQIEPEESAEGICGIIEKKIKIHPDNWFIDYKGEEMPL